MEVDGDWLSYRNGTQDDDGAHDEFLDSNPDLKADDQDEFSSTLYKPPEFANETNYAQTAKFVSSTLAMAGFPSPIRVDSSEEIGRAVQQECRDRSRMPSSA
eukprot:TRINITY_DN30530_c0_g1_i1.p1 TRINITY_DN30530_c0_g1~~TRINITY_DN30530_c0_g1_i1.p1  ORF type:complete len:102 (-),score=27.98 TRINITY_DN30530_c0_g1_i1:10-315(-)